ncbi:ornithine cyclodeaminase [Burkholderia cepacia]|uniref:ornithine cyclodeaminase n=1 Tax=Burkholderia cepacia TaxID=292 RepID=UPI001FC8D999|nr:ornithine cyclodeaminase [Burkholderia cepacia]
MCDMSAIPDGDPKRLDPVSRRRLAERSGPGIPALEAPLIDPAVVGQLARRALVDVKRGKTVGVKAVLQPDPGELNELVDDPEHAYAPDERANWKLNALLSKNRWYCAAKLVGSHSYNRHLGLDRSQSWIMLYDKLTMLPLALFEGTDYSTQRTGAYASIVVDCLLNEAASFQVFIFGTGRVAAAVIDDLQAHHAGRIKAVYVKSHDRARAEAFASEAAGRVSFPVMAVERLERLAFCDVVVTASNAASPLFAAEDIGLHAVVLHLGGDETPASWIRHVLEAGTVICDDVEAVAHRASQSLALYFSNRGRSLEDHVAPYQILNLWQILDDPTFRCRRPALVTCVGMPVLDLYLAQYAYEHRELVEIEPANDALAGPSG